MEIRNPKNLKELAQKVSSFGILNRVDSYLLENYRFEMVIGAISLVFGLLGIIKLI